MTYFIGTAEDYSMGQEVTLEEPRESLDEAKADAQLAASANGMLFGNVYEIDTEAKISKVVRHASWSI
ncbi:hypothetical protein UFOVP45_131 [uncultured Caudovirales phage]|uniref:Uncharacterized protein n=1 Tax=uncultured Caudovirales phage TaxID=2100421 RepID=A0A6J5KV24_9CAUD|nr:hypothetical protein UFOVP45_131 [uncultured Caudovirales phage]